MNVYIDSSIVVGIMLEQKQYQRQLQIVEKAKIAFSSHLLEAEVFSVACREGLSFPMVDLFLKQYSFVYVEKPLHEEYSRIFGVGYLRGADALHLATALHIDPNAEELVFLTDDKRQKSIAKKLGFKVQ